MMLSKKESSVSADNRVKRIFIIGILIIYFLRIINLDQDLPPWGIGYYQPIDEGAYSEMAYNMITYGTINPDTPEETGAEMGSYTPHHLRMNIIGNIFSFVGLRFLGNNYYGLRFPYVMIGAINFLVFYLILLKLNRKDFKLMAFFMILLVFDFMFFMASRVAETTSVRLMLLQLLVYTFLCLKKRFNIKFFLLGFLTTISVFMVYITNIFLYLACAILIVYLHKKNIKQMIKAIGLFGVGSLAALFLCEVYYKCFWDIGAIENALFAIKSFSASNGYTISGVTEALSTLIILQKFLAFWGANSLLYNLPIVLIVFLSFPFVIYYLRKKEDDVCAFLLLIIGSFWLQTMFVEDCIGRKGILIFTCLLIYIYYLITLKEEIKLFIKVLKSGNLKRFISCVYVVLVTGLCGMILLYRFRYALDNTYTDFGLVCRAFIIVLGGLAVVLLSLEVLHSLIGEKHHIMSTLFVSYCLILALNIGLIYRFQIKNPTFFEREAMIGLEKYINKENVYVVGGGHQLGFALYNNMKFLLAPKTEEIAKYMEVGDNILLIDYELTEPDVTGMTGYYDYLFNKSKFTIRQIHIIERNFQAYGNYRNSGLFERKLKE